MLPPVELEFRFKISLRILLFYSRLDKIGILVLLNKQRVLATTVVWVLFISHSIQYGSHNSKIEKWNFPIQPQASKLENKFDNVIFIYVFAFILEFLANSAISHRIYCENETLKKTVLVILYVHIFNIGWQPMVAFECCCKLSAIISL